MISGHEIFRFIKNKISSLEGTFVILERKVPYPERIHQVERLWFRGGPDPHLIFFLIFLYYPLHSPKCSYTCTHSQTPLSRLLDLASKGTYVSPARGSFTHKRCRVCYVAGKEDKICFWSGKDTRRPDIAADSLAAGSTVGKRWDPHIYLKLFCS